MDEQAYKKKIEEQAKAIGKVVICWADIESLVISLDMMKMGKGRYRPRSETDIRDKFSTRRERFGSVISRALEGLGAMQRRLLLAKRQRDAIVHGVTMGWKKSSSETTLPYIVSVDAAATVFAQRWPTTRIAIPKEPHLSNEDISRLGTALHVEVANIRTLQVVIGAADRELTIDEGELPDLPFQASTDKFVWKTARANPAWTAGRNDKVGELVGQFVMTAATLERALRTLELMHTGKLRKPFEAIEDTDVAARRWQELPREKSITYRLREILKMKPALRKSAEEFFRYRNFVLHNPLSKTGRESEDWMPAFVHRRLVAVRDATLIEWEKREDVKMIPQWAWDKQQERGLVYASLQSIEEQKARGKALVRELNNMAYEASRVPTLQ